jgi:hypothetical protein
MIDRDIYYQNKTVEEFIESLKTKFKKSCSHTKIYISTTNPYDDWLKKIYSSYNNTKLTEE